MASSLSKSQIYGVFGYTETTGETREIVGNLTVFDNIGKVAVMNAKGPTQIWWVLWTHCLEEMVLRKYSYPEGFGSKSEFEDRFLRPRSRNVKRAIEIVYSNNFEKNQALFKFGKLEHLEKIFKEGRIRYAPATSYNDPSLNPSIRDEELSVSVEILPNDVEVELEGVSEPIPGSEIFPQGTSFYANGVVKLLCLVYVITLYLQRV